MEIIIDSLLDGAKRAKGLTVIIDVFRAFSTSSYLLNNGVKKIIPVSSKEESFKLKEKNKDFILVGEDRGIKVEGFDYGNSPSDIKDIDFNGKTVVLRTSAGTKGVVFAKGSKEILVGTFTNINATIDYIKKKNPKIVSLIAMGHMAKEKNDEDELCAQYIKDKLERKNTKFKKIKKYLKTYRTAEKFFDESKPEFPKGDFDCCLDIDKFNFVMKVVKDNNQLIIIKEEQ